MSVAYSNPYVVVADAPAADRARFIRNTYLHLALALAVFVGLETYLMTSEAAVSTMLGVLDRVSWLVVLGAFMVVSWIADWWASSSHSKMLQYAGLMLYIVAQAVIFMPLMYMVVSTGAQDVLPKAGIVTAFLFAGITLTAFISNKDFSFLRGFLIVGGLVALGTVVVGSLMGFNLGLWFAAGMVVFTGISILYTTSQIIHRYNTEQYVAASLSLFAGVALMFWYLVRIFMITRD